MLDPALCPLSFLYIDDTQALDGVVTFDIGSFDNPETIPIMVTDLYVELASLVGDAKASGTTTIQLRHGRPVAILFGLVRRQFRLAESIGSKKAISKLTWQPGINLNRGR